MKLLFLQYACHVGFQLATEMGMSVTGYYGDGFNAIVVLTACHLPDKRRRDYNYVMDNLFL